MDSTPADEAHTRLADVVFTASPRTEFGGTRASESAYALSASSGTSAKCTAVLSDTPINRFTTDADAGNNLPPPSVVARDSFRLLAMI